VSLRKQNDERLVLRPRKDAASAVNIHCLVSSKVDLRSTVKLTTQVAHLKSIHTVQNLSLPQASIERDLPGSACSLSFSVRSDLNGATFDTENYKR
jgi:hypothetical protein